MISHSYLTSPSARQVSLGVPYDLARLWAEDCSAQTAMLVEHGVVFNLIFTDMGVDIFASSCHGVSSAIHLSVKKLHQSCHCWC